MDGFSGARDHTKQAELPGCDRGPVRPPSERSDRNLWVGRLRGALAERAPEALGIAEDAVRACPGEPEVLLLAALAALAAADPERAFVFLKRYQKRYAPNQAATLLTALALAQQRQFARAWSMLEAERIEAFPAAVRWLVGDDVMVDWLRDRLLEIRLERLRVRSPAATPRSNRPSRPPEPPAFRPRQARAAPVAPAPPEVPDLPRLEARFDVRIEIADPGAIRLEGDAADAEWFRLRSELVRLSLLEGFDDLLCLPALSGVETHWYQVETVRKVLKQYRGRVLLADEVGLPGSRGTGSARCAHGRAAWHR